MRFSALKILALATLGFAFFATNPLRADDGGYYDDTPIDTSTDFFKTSLEKTLDSILPNDNGHMPFSECLAANTAVVAGLKAAFNIDPQSKQVIIGSAIWEGFCGGVSFLCTEGQIKNSVRWFFDMPVKHVQVPADESQYCGGSPDGRR